VLVKAIHDQTSLFFFFLSPDDGPPGPFFASGHSYGFVDRGREEISGVEPAVGTDIHEPLDVGGHIPVSDLPHLVLLLG